MTLRIQIVSVEAFGKTVQSRSARAGNGEVSRMTVFIPVFMEKENQPSMKTTSASSSGFIQRTFTTLLLHTQLCKILRKI